MTVEIIKKNLVIGSGIGKHVGIRDNETYETFHISL